MPASASDDSRTPDSTDSQRSADVKGSVTWSFANKVLVRGIGTIQGLILARILLPRDYGTFAVAQIVVTLALTVNDAGLSWALTRWQGEVHQVARTAQTLAVGLSTALLGIVYVVAPAFAGALHTPSATSPIRWLGLAIFIDGLASPTFGLLARRLLQRTVTACEASGAVVSIVLTIVLARHGAGVYSLVAGRIVGTAITATLAVGLSRERIRPGWSSAHAVSLLRVTSPVMTAAFVEVALLNVDYVAVSRALGVTELGYYVIAFNLANFAGLITTSSVSAIATAVFGASPQSFAHLATTGIRHLSTLMFPIVVVQACFSLVIIDLVYGTRWSAAAPAFALLSLMALARVLVRFLNDAAAAVGLGKQVLLQRVLWLAALTPAVSVAAHLGGITGVAISQALVAIIVATPSAFFILRRAGIRPLALVKGARQPVFSILISAPIVLIWFAAGGRGVAGSLATMAIFAMAYIGATISLARRVQADENAL